MAASSVLLANSIQQIGGCFFSDDYQGFKKLINELKEAVIFVDSLYVRLNCELVVFISCYRYKIIT